MTARYIHIPFCKQKCNYCDFVSYADKEKLIDEYVKALVREIKELRAPNSELQTIFFGGGTPTLLEPKHFNKIINELVTRYALRVTNAEISIEANPGTADKAKLKELRQLGLNRLSIGVQSFNNRHLKTLGRIHDAETAKRFYHDARAAGFDNINLDLIFALPGQTLEEWQNDLATAIELNPEHLSTYNLQIEEGTPFWEMFSQPSPAAANRRTLSQRERVLSQADLQNTFSPREKVLCSGRAEEGLILPSEDLELAMYEYAIEKLTAHGYKHYEISNFAKPGRECQHNLVYWRNENYLGVGAGAHSHLDGQRWSNPNCIEEYLKTAFLPLNKGENVERSETRGGKGETIFLGLRLLDGLAKDIFVGFEKEIAELITDKMLTESRGKYKLTRKGLYLANMVFEKFV